MNEYKLLLSDDELELIDEVLNYTINTFGEKVNSESGLNKTELMKRQKALMTLRLQLNTENTNV